jgi:dUTPase
MIIPIEHWEDVGIVVKGARAPEANPIKTVLESKERVALDLHVGSSYELDFSGERPIGDGFNLRPGECVRIEVDEDIKTPENVFGQVCSKSSQSADGLLVANLKIDPHFEGQIMPTVFNAGRKPVRITPGLLLGSVWFGIVAPAPVNPPPRNPLQKRRLELAKRGPRELLTFGLPYIITGAVTMVATLGAALLLQLVS